MDALSQIQSLYNQFDTIKKKVSANDPSKVSKVFFRVQTEKPEKSFVGPLSLKITIESQNPFRRFLIWLNRSQEQYRLEKNLPILSDMFVRGIEELAGGEKNTGDLDRVSFCMERYFDIAKKYVKKHADYKYPDPINGFLKTLNEKVQALQKQSDKENATKLIDRINDKQIPVKQQIGLVIQLSAFLKRVDLALTTDPISDKGPGLEPDEEEEGFAPEQNQMVTEQRIEKPLTNTTNKSSPYKEVKKEPPKPQEERAQEQLEETIEINPEKTEQEIKIQKTLGEIDELLPDDVRDQILSKCENGSIYARAKESSSSLTKSDETKLSGLYAEIFEISKLGDQNKKHEEILRQELDGLSSDDSMTGVVDFGKLLIGYPEELSVPSMKEWSQRIENVQAFVDVFKEIKEQSSKYDLDQRNLLQLMMSRIVSARVTVIDPKNQDLHRLSSRLKDFSQQALQYIKEVKPPISVGQCETVIAGLFTVNELLKNRGELPLKGPSSVASIVLDPPSDALNWNELREQWEKKIALRKEEYEKLSLSMNIARGGSPGRTTAGRELIQACRSLKEALKNPPLQSLKIQELFPSNEQITNAPIDRLEDLLKVLKGIENFVRIKNEPSGERQGIAERAFSKLTSILDQKEISASDLLWSQGLKKQKDGITVQRSKEGEEILEFDPGKQVSDEDPLSALSTLVDVTESKLRLADTQDYRSLLVPFKNEKIQIRNKKSKTTVETILNEITSAIRNSDSSLSGLRAAQSDLAQLYKACDRLLKERYKTEMKRLESLQNPSEAEQELIKGLPLTLDKNPSSDPATREALKSLFNHI